MKFEEIANRWLSRKLSAATYKHANDLTNRIHHLNRMIGGCEIGNVKWIDFEDQLLLLSQHNPNTRKPASQKFINNILNTGKSVFEYAYELEVVDRNPLLNKKAPKCRPPKVRRSLTPTEEELIIRTPHRLQTAALIMMFAGLRVGELIPLQWDDIDFKEKSLKVVKSVQLVSSNKYEVKPGTKNTRCRIVPIPDILIPYLKKEMKNSNTICITTSANEEYHTPSTWKKSWKSYYNTLNFEAYNGNRKYTNPKGIPKVIDNITPHMLRHTYATLLYDADVDVLTAQKLLGHSNVTTTLAIYTHLDETKKLQSIDKFNGYLYDNFNGLF